MTRIARRSREWQLTFGCRFVAAFVCFAATLSCKKQPADEITLQVGPEQVLRFTPKSGFAHYFELPGQEDVLRIVLASYEVTCESYTPPQPGDAFVTVTVRVPADETIVPGRYLWKGSEVKKKIGTQTEKTEGPSGALAPPSKNASDTAEKMDLSLKEKSTRSGEALPFVRLAEDARALPPGGFLELHAFEAERFGQVTGELSFRDAGPGEAVTTALLGEFSVRLCRVELDPGRRVAMPNNK